MRFWLSCHINVSYLYLFCIYILYVDKIKSKRFFFICLFVFFLGKHYYYQQQNQESNLISNRENNAILAATKCDTVMALGTKTSSVRENKIQNNLKNCHAPFQGKLSICTSDL